MTFHTYQISAPHTNNVYYGVTRQLLSDRMEFHLRALQRGYHTNDELQAAYNADSQGWTMTHLATFNTKEAADDHETQLIQANARRAFNVQKNPFKFGKSFRKVESSVAAEILALRGEEYSYAVAKMFGVSQSTVSAIWRGVHWSSCNDVNATRFDLAQMARNFMNSIQPQNTLVSASV